MQLLRFPINLFPYKQLQFTWIEWINCIEVFSSLTNSLLECSSWRLLANSWAQRMANSLAQTLDNPKEGASLVVTLQENLVALQETRIALQEIRIALQEIRMAFISQYQNWVRNDWSVFLIAFDSSLLQLAIIACFHGIIFTPALQASCLSHSSVVSSRHVFMA